MTEYFKENPKGTMVSMDVDGEVENNFFIWFPYTINFMREIKVGDFVAVRNYNRQKGDLSFTILELVSVYPKHYALGSSSKDTEKAFPGFVIEAAKNAKIDWEQEEPVEQTTKIRCEAISIGLQLVDSSGSVSLEIDDSLPMIGEDAYVLTDTQVNEIVNKGLLDGRIKTIEPCSLILNRDVPVKISSEDLLKTHFGVFGFTGAGKSNLMSTMMNSLVGNGGSNKLVLFDLMTEYPGLLIDLLNSVEDAYILALDEESLPGSKLTEEVLKGDSSKIDSAAESITKTLLLPKELVPHRDEYTEAIKELFTKNKIRLFDTGSNNPTNSVLRAGLLGCIKGNAGNAGVHLRKIISMNLGGLGVDPVSGETLEKLDKEISKGIDTKKILNYEKKSTNARQTTLLADSDSVDSYPREIDLNKNETAITCLIRMRELIKKHLDSAKKDPLPENSSFSLHQINSILNEKDKPALIIVQSNRDDDLRDFSNELVKCSFDDRRMSGQISPHVLFIYDEADEFIPQQKAGNDSYVRSKHGCTLLARRGRKFGLGLGIATQRVAYLDTSILAQPHTFFLSKLPRAYDRDVIGKAFGTSDDMINRTLSFKVGQWLLFSYDATGLTNTPLPVQFSNANERIINWFHKT